MINKTVKKNSFILVFNKVENTFTVKKEYKNSLIDIAQVVKDVNTNKCSIITTSDNFQNYVLTYNEFKDFVYLVDSAYLSFELTNITN